jgi:hypothetical protein
MNITEVECEVVNWVYYAQYRIQWRDVVGAAINLRLSQKAGSFLTDSRGPCFMELIIKRLQLRL